jgi:hypothetical protein
MELAGIEAFPEDPYPRLGGTYSVILPDVLISGIPILQP